MHIEIQVRPHVKGVTKTTLPLSYPGWVNLLLTSLQNSAKCLHEVVNSSWLGKTTQEGDGGGGGVLGQGARQLEQKMHVHGKTGMFTTIFFICGSPFVDYVTWPNKSQQVYVSNFI